MNTASENSRTKHGRREEPARAQLISAALPYVNGPPHVGHALDIVQADVLARFARLRGDEVRYVTGSDENSLKNVRAASVANVALATLIAGNAERFLELNRRLCASLDAFVRTSADPAHARVAAWLFRRCRERGDIYKRRYGGLYCVGCEQFYKPDELVSGLCPEHACPPEWLEEDNYFFALSRYSQALESLIRTGALEIVPEERRNEVLQFIALGLHDFSVSRTRARAKGCGIPVPDDEEQVIFVWFDALGGYLSGSSQGGEVAEFWTRAVGRTHVIGKGIARFHAIYWPAVLLSAGLPPPTRICVHGYLTVAGTKIGKSLGNVVDPFALIERFGADPLRYYLLRHFGTTADGDFSVNELECAYDSELANQLGNLVQRVAGLLARYSAGVVPACQISTANPLDTELIRVATGCFPELEQAIDEFDLRRALLAVWGLVVACNRYIDFSEPWVLARRDERERLNQVLYAITEAVRLLSVGLAPFLPETAAAIGRRIRTGSAVGERRWLDSSWGGLEPGAEFLQGAALFPRLVPDPEHGP
jgi:methionyl-tRNA synthetase